MSHLSLETLARLVDEPATPEEAAHLANCAACRDELDAMRDDVAALRELPALEPPPADAWSALAARLREEGLIGRDGTPRPARAGVWLRAAAGIALFLLGSVTGALVARQGAPVPHIARPGPAVTEDPAAALAAAERAYLDALERYVTLEGPRHATTDPAARLVALERLVRTTRDALETAPADPILNGYHLAAVAQRDAALRQITLTSGGLWY